MAEHNEIAETLLSRESIVSRAKEKWDAKPSAEKVWKGRQRGIYGSQTPKG